MRKEHEVVGQRLTEGPLGTGGVPTLLGEQVPGRWSRGGPPPPGTVFSNGPGKPDRGPGRLEFTTWLILPVVICLSQRLSHACLSTGLNTVKLRMAH